ncbi:MAG: ABC transporter ATP-binding protein, partial [Quisquiliibacterium sp.]
TAGVDVALRQALWAFIRRLNREGHTIVLTTHYLEEAQELCERIAMLKRGQVVALDKTSALLRQFSGGQLLLKLAAGELPASLASLRMPEEAIPGRLALRVDSYDGLEPILAALREAGCVIEEMELLHTDLEDVFVRIMRDNN